MVKPLCVYSFESSGEADEPHLPCRNAIVEIFQRTLSDRNEQQGEENANQPRIGRNQSPLAGQQQRGGHCPNEPGQWSRPGNRSQIRAAFSPEASWHSSRTSCLKSMSPASSRTAPCRSRTSPTAAARASHPAKTLSPRRVPVSLTS